MSNKWVLIIAGAVFVLLAAAAALFLTSRNTPSPSTAGTGSSAIIATSSVGANATGTASTATTASGGTASKGGTSPKSGTNGAPANTPVSAIGPFPPLPDPGLPAKKVTSPVAKGETLTLLTEAPDSTISALKLGAIPDGSEYTIKMRPYGIGPSMVFGSRLAIRVDSATPVQKTPANNTIVNANLLVLVDTTHRGTVTVGGTYVALLTFRSDGTKLLPIMSVARAAD